MGSGLEEMWLLSSAQVLADATQSVMQLQKAGGPIKATFLPVLLILRPIPTHASLLHIHGRKHLSGMTSSRYTHYQIFSSHHLHLWLTNGYRTSYQRLQKL